MNTNIIESYKWLTPEFAITPTDGKTVKIRGKAIPRETISRNNRKYVDEELRKAARTFIDAPITENHKNWTDKKNHLGKVNWMEYDDGSMEYVAEVWNPEMAAELRAYAKNPQSTRIRGVSVEADFLKIACTKCQQEFLTESAWRRHMEEVEHIHDLPLEPHGIRGRALSIVTGKETPGVAGNTLEVMETTSPLFQLLETVIKLSKEKENMNVNTQKSMGPPYMVKEQTEPPELEKKKTKDEEELKKPEDNEEEKKPEEEEEDEEQNATEETTKISKITREAAPKLSLGEPFAGYDDFEACVKANQDKDNPEAYCGQVKKQAEETLHFQNVVTGKINEIAEAFNTLKIPKDDKTWNIKIKGLSEKLDDAVAELKAGDNAINTGYISQLKEIKEQIAAIPQDDLGWKDKVAELANGITEANGKIAEIKPYDDSAIKESIANIKPYDDKPLKEMVEAIPKDEWKQPLQEAIAGIKQYDDTELKTTMETTSKTLQENLDQMTQKTSLLETKLTTLETENKTLKETLDSKLKEYDTIKTAVSQADGAVTTLTEKYNTLTENYNKITKENLDLKEKLNQSNLKLKEIEVRTDNIEDKQTQTAHFKANAKQVVAKDTVPSSFNPYDPNRKP